MRIKIVNDLIFDAEMNIGKIIGFIFIAALITAFIVSYNDAVEIAQKKDKGENKVEAEPKPQTPESSLNLFQNLSLSG